MISLSPHTPKKLSFIELCLAMNFNTRAYDIVVSPKYMHYAYGCL